MTTTIRIVASLVIALSAFSPLFAQDTGIPDTIYYGDQGKVYGYPFTGQWLNTGTMSEYEEAIKRWKGFKAEI